jgi:photosystem II stability/assembly factor-like uncharacterized protein
MRIARITRIGLILFIRILHSSVFLKIRAIRVICFVFVLLTQSSQAQTIQILTNGTKTSIRGLSVVNDKVFWASGSNGTVARSTDGGSTFNWISVNGYGQRDFRDIEAFDSNTAIIMAVAEPAVILKTTDAGKTWKKVFEDSTKGMFLDAMDFNDKYGVVIGDPIDDKMFIAFTEDNGERWITHIHGKKFSMSKGEAFFASSGTNVKLSMTKDEMPLFFCVSGGIKSRFLYDDTFDSIPIIQGKESTGANSVAANLSSGTIVVVGGDFKNDKDTTGNCILSKDYGKTWQHPQTSPHGYRSCVAFIKDNQLITCGTSGIDISNNGGMNWTLISPESFHVCQKAKQGNAVFLAGKDGRIASLIF